MEAKADFVEESKMPANLIGISSAWLVSREGQKCSINDVGQSSERTAL